MTRLSLTIDGKRYQHGPPHQQSLAQPAPPYMWALLPLQLCAAWVRHQNRTLQPGCLTSHALAHPPPLSLWKLDLPEGVSAFNSVYGLIMLSGSVILALVHFKAS